MTRTPKPSPFSRRANEIGAGDFIRLRRKTKWKEVQSNTAEGVVPTPTKWAVTTTDGLIHAAHNIQSYAKAEDFEEGGALHGTP